MPVLFYIGLKYLKPEHKIIVNKLHCGSDFQNMFTQNCRIVGKPCFIPWHNYTIQKFTIFSKYAEDKAFQQIIQ